MRNLLFIIFALVTPFALSGNPLSGSYTVGGSNPDFTTVSAATDSLLAVGVAGPVLFNIRNGIYETGGGSERAFYLPDTVPGASGTNIVTFRADAASGATADRVIFRRRSGPNEWGWVAYIRADFVTLENLTFEYANDDTTLSGVIFNQDIIRFTPWQGSGPNASIDSITVRGCRITSSGSSRPWKGLYFTSGGDQILIENNFIRRVGDGIWVERCNGCAPFNNITIRDNLIENLTAYTYGTGDFAGKGIFISNGYGYTITGNEIDLGGWATALYGIQVIGGDVVIDGNRIRGAAFQQYSFAWFNGLYVRLYGTQNRISNNLIYDHRKKVNGIFLENAANVAVFHNTVVLSPGYSFVELNGLVLQSCSNIDVRNNILVTHSGTGVTNRSVRGIGSNSGINFDFNILYSEPFQIDFEGTTYDSLAAWQATGYDPNSRSFLPEFIDERPYYRGVHLGYCSLGDDRLWGTPLPEVPFDYDGEVRDPQNPYIGADEVDSFRPDIFTPMTYTPVEDEALFFASGDLDNDGDEDIAVVNNYGTLGGSEDISIFWNDGQGNFSSPVHLSMGVQPTLVKIRDIDKDGFKDLIATTNSPSGAPVIRWGQGNGSFAAPVDLPAPPAPLGPVTDFAFAPDFAISTVQHLVQVHFGTVGVDSGWVSFCFFDENTRNFYYSNDPNFLPKRAGMHPSNVITEDLNDDNSTDFAVHDWVTGKTTIFFDQGTGSNGYAAGQQIAVNIGTNSIHANFDVGDIDGDNSPDLVIGAWVDGTDSLAWLRNDGQGTFSLDYIPMDSRRLSRTFDLFDYEDDGDTDIISATTSNDVVLYRNDGSGGFDIERLCQISDYGNVPLTMLTENFNNDNYPDVVVLTGGNEIASMLNLNYVVSIDNQPSATSILPSEYHLDQNYPNPFNPSTVISWQLPVGSPVKLVVYEITGRKIITLVDEWQSAGSYSANFDARGLAGGMYFYRIQAGVFVQTRKMLLLK